jgi:hypothetical protein
MATTLPSLAPPAPASARTERFPLALALLAVLAMACVAIGGWQALTLPSTPTGPAIRLGDAEVTITHVERVTGLTSQDMAGMGHGIQGLVRDDSTLVRVSVVVSAGRDGASFDATRLRLVASGHRLPPLGASIGRSRLQPHGRLEGAVSFVVPRNGAALALGATGTPATLPLGHVDDAPPSTGEDHDHHHAGGH